MRKICAIHNWGDLRISVEKWDIFRGQKICNYLYEKELKIFEKNGYCSTATLIFD
jgi:hypothetical protein